jgi:hypothetical protein
MIPIPTSGTLTSVGGIDDVRSLPLITGVEITIPLGRPVRALPEGDRYLGFVFAAGEDGAGVEAALREAEELLDVEIVAGVSGAGTAGGGEAGTAASTPVELGEARDTVS